MDSPYFTVRNSGESIVVITKARILPSEVMEDQWLVSVKCRKTRLYPNENVSNEEMKEGRAEVNVEEENVVIEGKIKGVERRLRDGQIVHASVGLEGSVPKNTVPDLDSGLAHDIAIWLLSTVEPVGEDIFPDRFPESFKNKTPWDRSR